MQNEIFESGQYVRMFAVILTQQEFEQVVLLVSPDAPSYIHRAYPNISYDVQVWNYKNLHTGKMHHTLFCLGRHLDTVQVHVNSSNSSTSYTFHYPT